MISFPEIWNYTNQVYGSFSQKEAEAMYTSLLSVPQGAIVVELGSYCGRSASLIGRMAMQGEKGFEFYCVDNFVTPWEDKDVKAIFDQNMRGIKHELLQMNSKRAFHLFSDYEIDFLFIDGDHLYEAVKEDLDNWAPKVQPGAPILLHDYNSSWDGVKKAADEEDTFKLVSVADSLALGYKV